MHIYIDVHKTYIYANWCANRSFTPHGLVYSTVCSNTNQQTISITHALADHKHPTESTCSPDQVIK